MRVIPRIPEYLRRMAESVDMHKPSTTELYKLICDSLTRQSLTTSAGKAIRATLEAAGQLHLLDELLQLGASGAANPIHMAISPEEYA